MTNHQQTNSYISKYKKLCPANCEFFTSFQNMQKYGINVALVTFSTKKVVEFADDQ
jgi:hypothetical protein